MVNVLPAAQQHHVRRVVFASSYFVVAVQCFSIGALTTTMEPALIDLYDASKLFSARVGKMFSERYGVSFIALRMGMCVSAPTANSHGARIPFGRWRQTMWVSGRDLCRAFEHVVDEERISFGVYNLVSHNPGMRWEIATLTRDLDFVPQGWGRCALPMVQSARLARVREVGPRKFGDRLAGARR
jgi:NAD+ dependent glucose-6-phosphate dehydrogenase